MRFLLATPAASRIVRRRTSLRRLDPAGIL